jgi:hypothetical protein
MGKALLAMARDHFRQASPAIRVLLVFLIGASIVLAGQRVQPSGSDREANVQTTALIFGLFFVGTTGIGTSILKSRRRLFVVPLTSAAIGTCHIIIGCVSLLFCYAVVFGAYEWMFQMGWPHVSPMLAVAGVSSVITAGAWRFAPVMYAEEASILTGNSNVVGIVYLLRQCLCLSPAIALVAVWFWIHAGGDDASGWRFRPVIDMGMAVLTIGTSWLLLVPEIESQRHSETFTRIGRNDDMNAEAARTITWENGRAATRWLLWESSREFAIGMALSFAFLLILAGITGLWDDDSRTIQLQLLCVFFLFPLSLGLGMFLNLRLDPSRHNGLRTFLATHRLSDKEFGTLVLCNAFRTYTLFWVLSMTCLAALMILVAAAGGTASDPFGQFVPLMIVEQANESPLLALAVLGWTWAIGWSITGATLGLERKWLCRLLLAAGLLCLLSLLKSIGVGFMATAINLTLNLMIFGMCALPGVLTVVSFVRAKQRGLLSLISVEPIIWISGVLLWVICCSQLAKILDWEPNGFIKCVLGGLALLSLSCALVLPRAAIPVMLQARRRQ